jgi:4-amino-4-deoxy-L-arabinose transferase-like glycosyltransferase
MARRPVPAPLAALLAAVLVLGLAWALVNPAMQAPDENAHTGYVQSLADGPGLPGDPARQLFSTEQRDAALASNAEQTAAIREARPEWNPQAYDRWRQAQAALTAAQREDGGGPNPAASNPPAYYLLAAGAYKATASGDFFDRLLAARLVGLAWLLVTVVAVWLLAGEVLGRRRPLQLAAAAVAGMAPMMTFVSASVSPDGMMYALWSLALWLGVRVLKRGLTVPAGVALFAAVGLACCVKAQSYALVPGALAVLAVGLRRRRPIAAGPALGLAAASLLGFVLTAGVWYATARGLDRAAAAQVTGATGAGPVQLRELGSYLWQFYLPRLPFQQDFFPQDAGPRFFSVWLQGGWARFGWLEVRFGDPVYWVLGAVTAAVAAGAALALWRTRARLDLAVGLLLALVAGSLLAGLHWSEYRISVTGFNQGRYLLPLIGIAGLAVAQALTLLPAHRRAAGAAVVLAGLFALQIFSLALVAERFYA